MRQIALHAGWYLPHEKICWISERHNRVKLDERNRPHSHDGMAVGYPDGWGIYAWHGVRVTEQIIIRPDTLTSDQILGEQNSEVRRVMVERFGLDRFLSSAHAKELDSDQTGQRRLYKLEWSGDEPIVAVKVQCPTTGQVYFLRVPPTIKTCRAAVAWTFGFEKVRDYEPLVET